MPPCLLAIRSLLGSSCRCNARSPRLTRPFPVRFQSSTPTTPPGWRSPAPAPATPRAGIAVDGGRRKVDPSTSSLQSSPPSETTTTDRPVGAYTPVDTTESPLGAYTSVGHKPYTSPSDKRDVRLMVDGQFTHQYSSQWDPAYAKLDNLHYTERQDEDPTTRWRRMVSFDRPTVELSEEVRALCIQHQQLTLRLREAARRSRWTGEEDEGRVREMDGQVNEQVREIENQICQLLLHQPDRRQRWYAVMLWLLAYDPLHAMILLHATHHHPNPPLHAVQDSLFHLAKLNRRISDERTRKQRMAVLASLVQTVAHRSDGKCLDLPGATLAIILVNISTSKRLLLWEAVQKHQINLHWFTHLHLTTHLAKSGHLDHALNALSEAHRNGADLTHEAFLSTCSTLLRSAMRQPSGLRVCLRIVDSLVEMGVRLNLILCNVIMLNAVEAQDVATAWSIYHSLPKYGLEASSYTFAILLKACQVNLKDADMLNETIRSAIAHVDVKSDKILAANILHTLALHHTKHNPGKAFETLVDAYNQLFDATPLIDLGILPPSPSPASLSGEKKMLPSHSAIGVMLTTYLDQLFLQTHSPVQPRALYHRYRDLVKSGVEPWCSMIDKDYIPNAFLVTLTKTKAGLLAAAEIIKNMQREATTVDGDGDDNGESTKVRQCEPTVKSWTIFMHGFQRHGQMKMAEQVLEYMRKKGVEPDQVTWNVLVEGYAVLQDEEGMENALERLKKEGSGWDEWTGRSVEKLKRGGTGKRRGGRELDFVGDLRKGLERKIMEGEKVEEEGEAKYTPIV